MWKPEDLVGGWAIWAAHSAHRHLLKYLWKLSELYEIIYVGFDLEYSGTDISELGLTERTKHATRSTTQNICVLSNIIKKGSPKPFGFGKAVTVPTTAGLIPILDELFSRGKQVVLIGFDVGQDLGVLEADCGWTPPVGTEVIDTQSIAKTFFLQNDGVGLDVALAAFGIAIKEDAPRHNGGNDSWYHLELMFAKARHIANSTTIDLSQIAHRMPPKLNTGRRSSFPSSSTQKLQLQPSSSLGRPSSCEPQNSRSGAARRSSMSSSPRPSLQSIATLDEHIASRTSSRGPRRDRCQSHVDKQRASQSDQKRASQFSHESPARFDQQRPSPLGYQGASQRNQQRPSQASQQRPSPLNQHHSSQYNQQSQSLPDQQYPPSSSHKYQPQLDQQRAFQLGQQRPSQPPGSNPSATTIKRKLEEHSQWESSGENTQEPQAKRSKGAQPVQEEKGIENAAAGQAGKDAQGKRRLAEATGGGEGDLRRMVGSSFRLRAEEGRPRRS